jgi:aspartate/methionine/tyrosine aminotransferase
MMERLAQRMTFDDFIAWSEQVARTTPEVQRLCETRISKAFSAIRPVVDVPDDFPTVHRCDLALQWCSAHGFLATRARQTLICEGVRHALGVIFTVLAQAERSIAIPRDVYPVYRKIASASGILAIELDTFPTLELQSIFDACHESRVLTLLLPAPLKIHGRCWTEEEAAQTRAWLTEDPQRLLILDGVYSFGLPIDAVVENLIETNQVIYLDSLSKGWLHERVLGAAFVPERLLADYADAFRNLTIPQSQLFRAKTLLSDFVTFPLHLKKEMDARRNMLTATFDKAGLRTLPASRGYFIGIEANAQHLLQHHNLLTIPLTVFGSEATEWSVASLLPTANT